MSTGNDGRAVEARRQQLLLMSLQAAPTSQDDNGIRAYRANAHASAERALSLACPTVRALLGAQDFTQLVREFWRALPPERGDLGEWGNDLPSWLEAHQALSDWPYLGDCARLDLALHHCERAADAKVDAASFGLLANADPSQLQLLLMPGVQGLVSRWPLASIYAAHAASDEALFDTARAALRDERGEAVVVDRAGWRACVRKVEAPIAVFTQALAAQYSLGQALDSAADGFDFSAWLADGLRHNWVKEARYLSDEVTSSAAGAISHEHGIQSEAVGHVAKSRRARHAGLHQAPPLAR
ncbi:MAG: DNA-binding domain-containing protein [Burkholderiaceae bacterium]|nr:DNA-binding domain-containing protein [Burkholderiaceae bacterium]